MIKTVYYVLDINFPIKSPDSCCKEVVSMKCLEKYIKLRCIVKKWGLKNSKTQNILAEWRKLKFPEKVLQNFSGLILIQ